MKTFFTILGTLFNGILIPFSLAPPLYGFLFIAFITGLLAVVIFKYISNQKELKRIMGQIKLSFMEIYLYKDDLSQVLQSQKHILKNNFAYFKYSTLAAIPIMCSVLLILSQVNLKYSLKPIKSGETFTLQVTMTPDPGLNPDDIALHTPQEVEIITPGFYTSDHYQIEWQLKAHKEGNFRVSVHYRNQEYKKEILIGSSTHLYSPHMGRASVVETIFNPLEDLLPADAPVSAIDIKYKPLYFMHMHWLIAFLVSAIAAGLVFRKLLKVS
ncbi:MAG: hypothetical protein ACMUJM_06055 [bacterium]